MERVPSVADMIRRSASRPFLLNQRDMVLARVYGFDGDLGTTMTSVDHELTATGWTDTGPSMISQLAEWHVAGPADGLIAVVYRSVNPGDAWTAAIGWAQHPEPLLPNCQHEYHTVVIQRSCVDLAGVLRSVLAGHRYAMEFTVGGPVCHAPRIGRHWSPHTVHDRHRIIAQRLCRTKDQRAPATLRAGRRVGGSRVRVDGKDSVEAPTRNEVRN